MGQDIARHATSPRRRLHHPVNSLVWTEVASAGSAPCKMTHATLPYGNGHISIGAPPPLARRALTGTMFERGTAYALEAGTDREWAGV